MKAKKSGTFPRKESERVYVHLNRSQGQRSTLGEQGWINCLGRNNKFYGRIQARRNVPRGINLHSMRELEHASQDDVHDFRRAGATSKTNERGSDPGELRAGTKVETPECLGTAESFLLKCLVHPRDPSIEPIGSEHPKFKVGA